MAKGIPISPRKLAAIRNKRVQTQEEFARDMQTSIGNVRRIEAHRGATSVHQKFVRRLAEVMGGTLPDVMAAIRPDEHDILAGGPIEPTHNNESPPASPAPPQPQRRSHAAGGKGRGRSK